MEQLRRIGARIQERLAALVGRPAFWVLFLSFLFFGPLLRIIFVHEPVELPVGGKVGKFALTDQMGRNFGRDDLKGRVWIGALTCTSCSMINPEWVKALWKVQHRSRNLGGKFRIVSFTVDPKTDTPEVLAEFAREHRTSRNLWSFVTGEKAELNGLIGGLFGGGLQGGSGGGTHTGSLLPENLAAVVLVDQNSRIRGYYDIRFPKQIDKMLSHVGLLVNSQSLHDPVAQ